LGHFAPFSNQNLLTSVAFWDRAGRLPHGAGDVGCGGPWLLTICRGQSPSAGLRSDPKPQRRSQAVWIFMPRAPEPWRGARPWFVGDRSRHFLAASLITLLVRGAAATGQHENRKATRFYLLQRFSCGLLRRLTLTGRPSVSNMGRVGCRSFVPRDHVHLRRRIGVWRRPPDSSTGWGAAIRGRFSHPSRFFAWTAIVLLNCLREIGKRLDQQWTDRGEASFSW